MRGSGEVAACVSSARSRSAEQLGVQLGLPFPLLFISSSSRSKRGAPEANDRPVQNRRAYASSRCGGGSRPEPGFSHCEIVAMLSWVRPAEGSGQLLLGELTVLPLSEIPQALGEPPSRNGRVLVVSNQPDLQSEAHVA